MNACPTNLAIGLLPGCPPHALTIHPVVEEWVARLLTMAHPWVVVAQGL
jgi:hypothetical protein